MVVLQEEIDAGRSTVKADAFSMSIGELVNLYKNRELVIRPEYQRLFRWSQEKKSRLIESILLGIPLPSIFVMQRHDGIWEVIDGLQRISTILEFMGELINEASGEQFAASRLTATRYLRSLQGMAFESEQEPTLSPGQRIAIKRSKIDVKILLPESDDKAKYELFDRLNSGGESASPQEVRNVQLIMADRTFFQWLSELKEHEGFRDCALVSSRQGDEQYDLELVCRFIALSQSTSAELKAMPEVDTYLTEKMLKAAVDPDFDRQATADQFRVMFSMLSEALGSESFRRYDATKGRFTGGLSVSAFEAVTTGLRHNLTSWTAVEDRNEKLREKVISLWDLPAFRAKARGGVRGTTRIPAIVPAAKSHFKP
ncbi:DUF262 domain-containing protein [Micromonospora sp. NBC_00821]|uniref:DUF262 domain-containing protein n=1 Tax=Micromonospora sp. NBC_00821 TaxID=2975977 RepID=UPI002ED457C8|nr:DUF262 domain-containing protein [Micromonospora sp. NBC_00821]